MAMDLSVVIVNWKVKDLLRKCLESVYRETKDIGFEVFVVDNDSRDGSVEMVAKEFPQATLIASNRNLGFAKANNEAIRRAQGEFVLLLNPDTEIIDNALAKLVEYMRQNPQAAICGPRLLNPDRTLQKSVRRFPDIWSQALISLKLHHLLRKLPVFRRYFADDFDYSRASQCDQVMGAAFMVRGSLLQKIGLMDERYFIWFEEVDLCKAAAKAGFQTWFTPMAEVIHHGGESFGQVMGPVKQRVFNESCRQYFRKHHGWLSWALLLALHPLSMLLAWLVVRRVKGDKGERSWAESPMGEISLTFHFSLLLIVLLEILSFLGQIYPDFSSAGFVIVVALALALAVIRFDLAALMLLAELFIGSQGGYLFSYGSNTGLDVSLRLGLFLAVFGVWLARTAVSLIAAVMRRQRPEGMEWFSAMRYGGLLWPYLALLAIFAAGLVHGVLAGNDFGNVFFDANGYAFFALFPVIVAAFEDPLMPMRTVGVLLAAIVDTVLKALFVLYIFSHRMFTVAPYVYVWVRDTRVGEITKMVGDFYRVFFQAHLYALVFVFSLLLLLAYSRSWKRSSAKWLLTFLCVMMTGVLMGFSRSFWFGGFGAVLAMAAILVWGRAGSPVWKKLLLASGVAVACAALIIITSYSLPFPRKGAAVSLASLLGDRAFSLSGEAAANSRWALLPVLWKAGLQHPLVGSGLGTTVTYTTSDPRLLASNPTGEYVTFAFEWGYHDLWVKFGLLGLAVYGWLIWAIAAPFWHFLKRSRQRLAAAEEDITHKLVLLTAGALIALTALLFTNVFSPYLNHPLGIGLIMCLGAVGAWRMLEAKPLPVEPHEHGETADKQ